jgi:uncharacterized membrane protein
MDNKENLPKVKLKRTSLDWVIEVAGFSFLVVLIALPLVWYNKLPDTIPVHFNAAGEPDGYGGRATLWIIPVTGLFMWLLFTVLEAFPQVYNFPVKITPENIVTQYRMATRLIRILKSVILIIFSFISFQTIKTATGGASGLGKAFLPVFLLITFGVIIIYLARSMNNRESER